ncbi:MAG: methyltransferase [Candidatus Rhabdochlamydia sp.]
MKSQKLLWQEYEVAEDNTHHHHQGMPAYTPRFLSVLKFHAPGLAPVEDFTGSFHINEKGEAIYSQRFLRTFGFYHQRSTVVDTSGWYHINERGEPIYPERYKWCGNYQEGLCAVQDFNGNFFHLNLEGKKAYPHVFTYVGDFHDGAACVQDAKGFYTHINPRGEFIYGKRFLDLDVYHKGFARAKDQRGWFHINQKGEEIASHRFLNVEPFYNGIARAETLEGALIRISEEGHVVGVLRKSGVDAFHEVSRELTSYWRFYTLQAGHHFHLFDHLPQTSQQLSNQLNIPLYALDKLLKALQEMQFVLLREDKCWECTSKGALLRKDHPRTLAYAATLWGEEHLTCWQNIEESLKTGAPFFPKAFHKTWFEWLGDHPEKNSLYHDALASYAKEDYEYLESIPSFLTHKRIVDIGGGSGTLLFSLMKAHPHLEGYLFDLPHVLDIVKVPFELKDQTVLTPGHFFEPWPIKNMNGCILSRVLHDWDDKEALILLKKARDSLSDSLSNRIYILEKVQEEEGYEGALLDLHMLIMTGGKERSLKEFQKLIHQADLSLESVTPFNKVTSLLTVKKRE